MADEAKMRSIDTVDFNMVKAAVKELNDGELMTEKIKVVAVKKEVLVSAFVKAVTDLDAAGKEEALSESVVAAYNHIFTQPPAGEKKDKTSGDGKTDDGGTEKKKPPIRQGLKFDTFEKLTEFLSDPKTPTNEMDAMLIKGGKLKDLVEEFGKTHPDTKVFKTPSSLKSHIAYREEKSNWQFETGEEDHYKLIGCGK